MAENNRIRIKEAIRNIPDFPKEGIQFKDITTLLAKAETLSLTLDELAEDLKDYEIDTFVGMEARGFIFAPALAIRFNKSFNPIRKPSKLPYNVVSKEYTLEYGSNTIEMHADAIQKGDKVVIHDDLLATGGTALAAAELIQECGGEVVAFSFIIELDFLEARKELEKIAPVHSLVHY